MAGRGKDDIQTPPKKQPKQTPLRPPLHLQPHHNRHWQPQNPPICQNINNPSDNNRRPEIQAGGAGLESRVPERCNRHTAQQIHEELRERVAKDKESGQVDDGRKPAGCAAEDADVEGEDGKLDCRDAGVVECLGDDGGLSKYGKKRTVL